MLKAGKHDYIARDQLALNTWIHVWVFNTAPVAKKYIPPIADF